MAAAEVGAVGEPEVVADNQEPARMEGDEPSVQQVAHSGACCAEELQNSNKVHESDMQAGFKEWERRRKGKGLLVDEAIGPILAAQGPGGEKEAIGPNVATRILRPTNSSDENSYDPLDVDLCARRQSTMDSDKAISAAGPVCGAVENMGCWPDPIQGKAQHKDARARRGAPEDVKVIMEEAARVEEVGHAEDVRGAEEGVKGKAVARGGPMRGERGAWVEGREREEVRGAGQGLLPVCAAWFPKNLEGEVQVLCRSFLSIWEAPAEGF